MSEKKKYKYCSQCGKNLKEEYFMIQDNYLQRKYFQKQDGSDNAFCSKDCVCDYLMVNSVENC